MTHEELDYYIRSRYGYLSSDEILHVVDTSNNPQLNHIVYENNIWKLWDINGNYYEFRKRIW